MANGNSRSSSKKRLTNGSKSSKTSKNKEPKTKDANKDTDSICVRKLSAILTRFLFALHSGIALWRVSFDYPTEYIGFLAIGLALLVVEMVFTLAFRQGREYKWFCPSVLFYLMSVIPCLWLLELARLDRAMVLSIEAGVCNNNSMPSNSTLAHIRPASLLNSTAFNRTRRGAIEMEDIEFEELRRAIEKSRISLKRMRRRAVKKPKSKDDSRRGKRKRKVRRGQKNEVLATMEEGSGLLDTTYEAPTEAPTTFDKSRNGSMDNSTEQQHPTKSGNGGIDLNKIGQTIKDGFSSIEHETANILNKTREEVTQFVGRLTKSVDAATWILLLHQVLLFVLVIGRWLLPKGEITRDQLSQLLLVFIGVGADILEFVTETVDSEDINENNCTVVLHYVIYGVWSWSLLQFTLVLTASKSRKTRVGFDSNFATAQTGSGCCAGSLFSSADLWGILVTLFLQDVPFLATRLYILIVYNLHHQMMIFFTGKNALVVILQIYRIVVLKLQKKAKKREVVDDHELQPLRGTLLNLARQATAVSEDAPSGTDVIRDATFTEQKDGSVIVKIHLEGEESLRKKRKRAAQA